MSGLNLPGEFTVRALLLGESLDLKGLERSDSYAQSPLAFRAGAAGTAMLFKSGAAVFFNMTPVEEEDLIRGLDGRIVDPLAEREIETVRVIAKGGEEELVSTTGVLQVKGVEPERLLLIAEALAVSVGFAHDERRIAGAFDRVEPVAATLMERKLPTGPQSELLEQIGEALLIQKRLAGRMDLDEKPDVLWNHPELERFWARLVDEYDLPQRARAIERKLTVIRESADIIRDLITTRTSFRLEWYVIALIAIEIGIGLYDRFFK
ncbi:MAG: RMD1 family protein [Hyphomicrobiales bacterium]|nr:MAG: RMD1 family protein [Hyphomicrobiales bacterium]